MYQTTTKPPVSKTTTTWHEAVQPTSLHQEKKNKKIHTKLLKWDSHSHCSIMQLSSIAT